MAIAFVGAGRSPAQKDKPKKRSRPVFRDENSSSQLSKKVKAELDDTESVTSVTTVLRDEHSSLQAPKKLKAETVDSESVTTESDFVMPRLSPRQELVKELKRRKFLDHLGVIRKLILKHVELALFWQAEWSQPSSILLERLSSWESRLNRYFITDHSLSLSRLHFLQSKLLMLEYERKMGSVEILLSSRYLGERITLPKSFQWLTEVLPNSPDRIFEHHTRMTRRSFGLLLDLLERNCMAFFSAPRGRKQIPLSIQLHLALFCFGFSGSAASYESARAKFGYSVGMISLARRRVTRALMSLAKDYITWPDSNERSRLCEEIRRKYGYRWAFFCVDGTTHNLAFVPKYERSSWYDRKSRYSVQALVSNDYHLRVRHILVGWPGSAHDARVLKSAEYMKSDVEDEYFTGRQHGLGDAAFGAHKRVVPNYKEPFASIPENREYNLVHSSLRVKAEHVIGHVKNRFQGLREIRLKLSTEKDFQEIVKFITAGYVLHNILMDFKDEFHPQGTSDMAGTNRSCAPIVDNHLRSGDECSEYGGASQARAEDLRETVKRQVLSFRGYE